jgi:hypothetical protein
MLQPNAPGWQPAESTYRTSADPILGRGVFRLDQSGHAGPIDLKSGKSQTGFGGLRFAGFETHDLLGKRVESAGIVPGEALERGMGLRGERGRVEPIENDREHALPRRVRPPCHAIKRRHALPRAGLRWHIDQRFEGYRLRARDRRHKGQKIGQRAAVGDARKTLGSPLKYSCCIG